MGYMVATMFEKIVIMAAIQWHETLADVYPTAPG